MYGHVFELVEAWMLNDHGVDIWHSVKDKAGCDVKDNGFQARGQYDLELLVGIVGGACAILDSSTDKVLGELGLFIARYLLSSEYASLMRCQGSTLRQWLSYLNAMHDHFQKTFNDDSFLPPVFWCEDCEEVEGSILLHYYSHRGNLFVPMVVGIVKEIASYHFKVEINMDELSLQDEVGAKFTSWRIYAIDERLRSRISPKYSDGEAAVIECPMSFSEVKVKKCPFTGKQLGDNAVPAKEEQRESCPFPHGDPTESVTQLSSSANYNFDEGISMNRLTQVFPFHVIVDQDFRILQVGANLPKVLQTKDENLQGVHIQEVLRIVRPSVAFSWDWRSMNSLSDQHFFVSPTTCGTGLGAQRAQQIQFKASMLPLSKNKLLYSLCPHVKNLQHLEDMHLTLSDLSLVTSQRDAVFLSEYVSQEAEKTHALEKLSHDLKSEQKLSNTLLYNILPSKVADDLRAGRTVEPMYHEQVTLFFSDIEGFTELCQQVEPWEVINMMNQLYSAMDSLVDRFDLYKVETVGDSYMCCSGLPEPHEYHSEKIANFALAVVECSKLIKSPATGDPVKLRIGIHTGSCTSGVVGTKTPHYCLFGDMVNFASRHESSGAAGKIHCSGDLFDRLKFRSTSDTPQYHFKARGLVDMKGKGEHYTYWLESGAEGNHAANPKALKAVSEDVNKLISSNKWKTRRYFQDDTSTTTTSVGGSRDRSALSTAASENDASIMSTQIEGIEGEEKFDSDRQVIIGFPKDLLSDKSSEWQGLSIDSSLSTNDVASQLTEVLVSSLKACVDKGEHRQDIVGAQLRSYVHHIASDYYNSSTFHSFHSAVEEVLCANFLWELRTASGQHDPWDGFVLLFATLVHDLKNIGVSNRQLEIEGHPIVEQYLQKGSYQQRCSMDVALDILEDDFEELYDEIFFGCPAFRKSVKKLMVLDADMEAENTSKFVLREFSQRIEQPCDDGRLSRQRDEACLGIMFILATNGHYCQSRELFLRGNERQFQSKFQAFQNGRFADPREGWFEKQTIFFDETILPTIDLVQSILHKATFLKQGALENKSLWSQNGRESHAARLLPTAKVEVAPGTLSNEDHVDFLISKNVTMLGTLLREVAASHSVHTPNTELQLDESERDTTPYGEIQLAIEMKAVDCYTPRELDSFCELCPVVKAELQAFVIAIAAGYENNAFHNFQHASHVAHLSNLLIHSMDGEKEVAMSIVHDPLIRFAIVLSALVHDIGHTGVPNGRLAEENPALASKYNDKSIAEQNSIDVAWKILMAGCFSNLRQAIFGSSKENQKRLRQLLVNSVMATDIFDQGLRALREARCDKSSSCGHCKATLVMEQILQTSDVVHTMQSWELYREWNQCLFKEMYTAFLDGRADKDPSNGWYKGELWFFDNWVIPLAQNLKNTGVLNIISERLIDQAKSNRLQWEREGEKECRLMFETVKQRPSFIRSASMSTASRGSFWSENSTGIETTLASTIVDEIESLSRVINRYERKMETACGNLVAVAYKGAQHDPTNTEMSKQSWPNIRQHFREQEWYHRMRNGSTLTDDEIFQRTTRSPPSPPKQVEIKSDIAF